MKTIIYVYRGQIERGNGQPGYSWADGFSETSRDGLPLYPWLTRAECFKDAKAQGAIAGFERAAQTTGVQR